MKDKRIFIIVIAVLFTGVAVSYFFVGRSDSQPMESETEKNLSVVATFYPLQDFAESVGGDRAVVRSIVPAGTEPHDYEPTPQDIVGIYQADIFLLNGAGIDAWAEKLRPELEKRGVAVIRMSEAVTTLSAGDGADIADPHFWLDPVWARREAEAIRDALIARDPSHAEAYESNAKRFATELAELDTAYREGLQQCELDTIVTSHGAFAYLAKRYGFRVISVSGLSPESEPSPRALSDIAAAVRALGLRHIFFETLVSPKIAETLAREVGAETLVFDPLEGLSEEDRAAGKDYLNVMRENLVNLRTALRCQK